VGFLNKLTVGFVGRNLLTVLPSDQYVTSDPEFRNTHANDRYTSPANGIGIGGYLETGPPTKNYGFSVNVEF
jgi:hypothetical protein